MEDLEIKKYPSPVLRKISKAVGGAGQKERDLLDGMARTMYDNQGIGLAAPQIGLNLRVAIVDIGNGPMKFINPKILKKEGSEVLEEGCLSIPGATVRVKRSRKILVEFIDGNGDAKTLEAEGLLARAIQHEIDHLNGRLIIDYLNPIKKFFVIRNLK